MSTFHKIVLALAGSLNDGTSSPASQGNRALRNETNDLADRQAQPSAKTPPLLHRIGKGIGKFWIPIFLITATVLTQAPIEQAGAWYTIDEDGNVQSGPSPAAVPPPVVVVAKPLLKKGAILAGKWLIAVLAEYGVHSALDRVFQNNKDQEANAIVHGAKWVSNEYEEKGYSITGIPRARWTTMADMGDEDDTSSALGWDGPNHRSMTQNEAKGYLKRRIGKVSLARGLG